MEGDTGAFDRRLLLLLGDPADPSRMLGAAWAFFLRGGGGASASERQAARRLTVRLSAP